MKMKSEGVHMLLDKYLPKYDFTEIHTIKVTASAEAAYRAVQETTLGEISGFVRLLFWLRELPEKMAGRQLDSMTADGPMIGQMEKNGFTIIEEQIPREKVFGLIVPGKIGRVWDKTSGYGSQVANAEEFLAFKDPRYLLVVANLMVQDSTVPGVVTVYTESRTKGLSPQAAKDFRPYWAVIRPWSGLIRRLWLRAIKRRAERQST
jgi:hypothetical protein